METGNCGTPCERARLYYYDLLCGQGGQDVPREVIEHVRQCQYCRQQIDGLKQALSQPSADDPASSVRVVTAMKDILKLHFAYVEKLVTCRIVKSFLPSLAVPMLEVSIPTPITAHLDKCPQCSQELENIRRLNLTQGQLYRLSEFLAEEPCDCLYADDKKKTAARLVAEMNWQFVTADTLKHSCKCSLCRELVYRERQKMLDELSGSGVAKNGSASLTTGCPCQGISATGIFDYVFPYGLDPADDQYAGFRGSFTDHAVKCPACLSKMQQLHTELDAIAGSAGGEVVTVFHKDNRAKGESADEADRIYEGFPVRVEAAAPAEATAAKEREPEKRFDGLTAEVKPSVVSFAAEKRKRPRMKLSYDTKATIAACILIAVGITMFFYNPAAAKQTPLDKMTSAFKKVTNVHTMQFAPGSKAPISERWVSRTLGIDRITDEHQTILYDVAKKIEKSKSGDKNSVTVSPLSDETITDVKQNIDRYYSLPITESNLIPKDAAWSHVTSDQLNIPVRTEVYDFTWKTKNDQGLDILQKRRIFVDSQTFLPQKKEFYQKPSAQEDYVLGSTEIIEYPSDEEIKAATEGF